MNPLENFVASRQTRDIHKWTNYFEVYERHLSAFRGQPLVMLEIGVCEGGSLKMWRSYFGESATLIGADINEACRAFADTRIHIEIGDQEDPSFLERLASTYGPFDIVLDDGGHTMKQQIVTIETLFPHVKEGGVFIVEDTHTSYWPGFGITEHEPFMEYAKRLVDKINGWFVVSAKDPVTDWTRTVRGLHFYPSVVVLEKGTVTEPRPVRSGEGRLGTAFHEAFMPSLRGKTLLHDLVWTCKSAWYRVIGNRWMSDYYAGCVRLRREQAAGKSPHS